MFVPRPPQNNACLWLLSIADDFSGIWGGAIPFVSQLCAPLLLPNRFGGPILFVFSWFEDPKTTTPLVQPNRFWAQSLLFLNSSRPVVVQCVRIGSVLCDCHTGNFLTVAAWLNHFCDASILVKFYLTATGVARIC